MFLRRRGFTVYVAGCELAAGTAALKELGMDKSVENLLHSARVHLGCGYLLRVTAVRTPQVWLDM